MHKCCMPFGKRKGLSLGGNMCPAGPKMAPHLSHAQLLRHIPCYHVTLFVNLTAALSTDIAAANNLAH